MATSRFTVGEFDPSAYFTTGYNKYKDRVWLRKASAPSYSQPGTVVKNIDYSKMALPKVTWQTGYGPDRNEVTEKAAKETIRTELRVKRDALFKEWMKKNPKANPAIFNQQYGEAPTDFNVNRKYQENTNAQIQAGIPDKAKAPTSAYGSTLTDPELTKLQGRFKMKKMGDRYTEAAKMITDRAKYDKALGREKGEYGTYLTNYQAAFDRLKDSLVKP
jgi:hypothetical protein